MKTQFAMVGMMIVTLLAVGCEKTTTNAVIEISPGTATVDRFGAVTFTAAIPEEEQEARQLYYPLVWTVSNENLGSVATTGGNTAVYVAADADGVNTVVVRDQAGAEGVAAITQE